MWLQLCWAHLIRDVKYLTTLPDRATRGYGQRLLVAVKALFRTWHRRQETPEKRWQCAAAQARRELLAVVRRAPMRTEAQNIAKRFRTHGDAYFTFLNTPGIEPTNNGPERQIRFLAIDRKITQGTRGVAGASGSGPFWRRVPNRTGRPSTSSTARSSPPSTITPSPLSCLYLRDRVPISEI